MLNLIALNPPPHDDEMEELFDAAYQAHLGDHKDNHTQCSALNPLVNPLTSPCWQWRSFATENATRMVAFRRAILNGLFCDCCKHPPKLHTPEGTRY